MLVRLAWRSLWRHRRRTIITVVSIASGLMFVVFFVCLAEGLYHQLVDDAVRMNAGHVTLEHPAYRDAPEVSRRLMRVDALRTRIEALPNVEATKVVVLGQGLARSGAGAVGVAVMGVEPSIEAEASPLAHRLEVGSYLADDDGARVVIGSLLAERLDLAEGKKLVLSTNDADGALVEALFRVKGVFHTGAEEVDGYLVQAPLEAGRRLYGLGPDEATQVGILLDDSDAQHRTIASVSAAIDEPDVAVHPWQEVLPELAAFIRLDRTSDFTFQGLLIVLVLFTIFNTILMSVLERTREFAVLLAIGTDARQLRLQVLVEALFISALGCVLGLALGAALAGLVQVYGFRLSWFYEEGMTISGLAIADRLHARVTLKTLVWLGSLVMISSVFLAILPMRRVSRISVTDVLR